MQSTDIPVRFPAIFGYAATSTYKLPVPTLASGLPSGVASLELGFPPSSFGVGATPPDGRYMNGILAQITQWCQWQAAGNFTPYNATFSTAIGGYPKYAILASTTLGVLWQSNAENNTTDPDGGSPANWNALIPAGVSVATDVEVTAGTNNTKFASPLALSTSLGSVDSQSLLFPGGRIHKSDAYLSTITAENTYAINFATAFPNVCRMAGAFPINATTNINRDSWIQITNWGPAGFVFQVQRSNGTGIDLNLDGITWIADGY